MKYLLSIIVFAFTGSILWTVGSFSIDIEDMKARKIVVENTKFYSKSERIALQNKFRAKAMLLKGQNDTNIKNEIIIKNLKSDLPSNKSNSSLIVPEASFPIIIQQQTEENIVVKDFMAVESHLLQEPSTTSKSGVENYKKKILSKLFSSRSNQIKTPTDEIDKKPMLDPTSSLENNETLISTDKLLQDLNILNQSSSSSNVENPFEDFNFSKQKKLNLDLKTKTSNGKTLPNTRLTIENSQGQILLEGSTDIQGRFQKAITVFSGEKVYIRYYGVGISQEKQEITNQGE